MKYKLTPIEQRDGLFFKRDDLFVPFKDSTLNGGKVRQCFELIRQNADNIRANHNGLVATASSVHSPQGYIVARCAKQFGLNAIVGISADVQKSIKEHKPIQLASEIAEVRRIAKIGYSSVMNKRLIELQNETKHFTINFGMDAETVIAPIARQVENLPDELDILVVPGGSCISFAAILRGIKYYNKKVGKIICVQISGVDRRKRVKQLAPGVQYTYVSSKRHPYSKRLKIDFEGIDFDGIYEAKCFEWLLENINYDDNKTLFWIVSNFNDFR